MVTLVLNTDAEYTGKPGVPPVALCPFCGRILPCEGMVVFPGVVLWRRIPAVCTCEQGRAEAARQERQRAEERSARVKAERDAEIARKRDAARLPRRLERARFECATVTSGNRNLLDIARRYAEGFDLLVSTQPPDKTGLYISGDIGTGKSYTAACVANAVLDGDRSVIFTSALRFQADLKSAFRGGDESERDVLEWYQRAKLLILDDLGKEPPTAWGLSRLFELIDARNGAQAPVIVTSNYSPQALAKRLAANGDVTTARAIVDRLMQDCVFIAAEGGSMR